MKASAIQPSLEFSPALTATITPDERARLLPIEFHSMDALSAPEPSIGALIELRSGQIAAVVYGELTNTLTIELPHSEDLARHRWSCFAKYRSTQKRLHGSARACCGLGRVHMRERDSTAQSPAAVRSTSRHPPRATCATPRSSPRSFGSRVKSRRRDRPKEARQRRRAST